MDFTAEHEKQIKKIMDSTECPCDFKCYRSGFTELCKARDMGMETFLECLEPKASECRLAVLFGDKIFCKCQLRFYISRKLNK